jgi:hypothetical protein
MIIITGKLSELDELEREESAFRETHVYRYHRNQQNRWSILQLKSNHCNRWLQHFLRI